MIQPVIAIVEALVLAGGIAVSNGIDRSAARGRRPAPRRVVRIERTSEAGVARLIEALDTEKVRRANAEAEVLQLRAELEAAREVIDLLV